MAYVVLARKWRPMVFEDVVGQEHVTRTLMNSLKKGRIAHAYIFAGPRGVGKTTTARLLAKAVNCEKQPAVNPCNQCASCKSITEGNSMDVIEIDGASNRGIDEIRNLRENIRFAPANSRYKIYIIDEVHMLTKEAFNALLKTLEEPPAHAIFIFATTEIHRVPLTILSRCQRFDFKRIPLEKIQAQLQKIVDAEGIEAEPDALLLIARKADGSMRDAESVLDQMISFSGEKLTVEQVRQSLGLIDEETYFEFLKLMEEKDVAGILEYAHKIFSSGHDPVDYLQGLQEHFRNILLAGSVQDKNLLEVSETYRERYVQSATRFTPPDLIHIIHLIAEAENKIKFSSLPQLSLEMLLLKIAFKPPYTDLEEILSLVQHLKKSPAGGAAPSPTTTSSVRSTATSSAEGKKQNTGGATLNVASASVEYASSAPQGFGQIQEKLSALKKLKTETSPQATNKTASTPSATDISLATIRERWREVTQFIKKQKIALGSFLEDGLPYSLQNGELTIAYDKKTSFHVEHVSSNKSVIIEAIKKILGADVSLSFVTIDFEKEGIQREPRTPEEILEDIKQKEPIIRKIIDTFGLAEQ